jgi:AbrB family looped-hinge helix DNA binding protein
MKRETSTVTTKGQLVIPARLRKKYSIRKGTQVAFFEEDHRLVLQPVTDAFINSLRGSLKRKSSALDLLLKTRREERGR